MRRVLLGSVLALLAANPLAAQEKRPTNKGMWEIGPFGRYNFYGDSFKQVDSTKGQNSFGIGGRVGYFLSDKWNLEVDGSYNPTDIEDANASSVGLIYMPFHAGVNYNAPLSNKVSWFIGPRVAYNRYTVSDVAADYLEKAYEGSDWGFGGITGIRWQMTNWLAARFDATLDYIPSPVSGDFRQNDDASTIAGLQAGLGITPGRSCGNAMDSIRIEPKNAEIYVGDTQTFRVIGYRCDGQVMDLTDAALAASGGSLAGAVFTGSAVGCFDVTATRAARKKGTDSGRVCVKERPKPPVVLDRCELVPSNSVVPPGGTVNYTVRGYYSDGTSRDLPEASLNANGGTVTGRTYTAPAAGNYVVTAQCGAGKMATANVRVESINITLRALFEFDKTKVYQQAELDSLRWLAGQLKEHQNLNLTIFGHTDWVGSVKYNDGLGARRIKAVMDTLASYGVDRARMESWTKTSYGECQPIADNKTKAGRATNRRVEIYDTPSAKKYDGSAQCANKP
jgi:outer membrane protein OmpA-like peptidoglycan-associated protein